jgi:hypothetical protein
MLSSGTFCFRKTQFFHYKILSWEALWS